MKLSAFDVLGPKMVGPSSSHTAGACRIALVAHSLAPESLTRIQFDLYNSFSATHAGHGTDYALAAGILGMNPADERMHQSLKLAKDKGLKVTFKECGTNERFHPNTVIIHLFDEHEREVSLAGASLGGGRIQIQAINGVEVEITGELPTIFVSHLDTPGVLANLTRALSVSFVNIATMRTFRSAKGGSAYTIFELDEAISASFVENLKRTPEVIDVAQVIIPGVQAATYALGTQAKDFDIRSAYHALELSYQHNMSLGELMFRRECALIAQDNAQEIASAHMSDVLQTMREETRQTIEEPEVSLGGFLYGQAREMIDSIQGSCAFMGETMTKAAAYAMAVLERSATMGVIMAAPTAGSSGVVPGVLLAYAEELKKSDEELTRALWNASFIGALITEHATVAGAEGGCQAEVGAAAAMAASALVELVGGTPKMAEDAAALAITNLMGLVCDPARGMVEYPCQDRNVIGVCAAVSAAQLVMAHIHSPAPLDEAIAAMASVGRALPASLRETARGGIALAPSVAGPLGQALDESSPARSNYGGGCASCRLC